MVKDKEVVIPPFRELFAKEIAESKKAFEDIDKMLLENPSNYNVVSSNGWCMMDCGTWDEFAEASAPLYANIAKECKKHGITHVYDIGCCTAWQGRIFKAVGIEYTGIEAEGRDAFFAPKEDGITFVHSAYPYPIQVEDREHTAAISNLCVGFSLLEGNPDKREDFTLELYKQLAADFDYFIGNVGPDEFKYFNSRFGILGKNEHCACWGNREKFHEFNEEAKREVFKDMSIFGEFNEKFLTNMIEEDKKESKKENKVSLKPKVEKKELERDSR